MQKYEELCIDLPESPASQDARFLQDSVSDVWEKQLAGGGLAFKGLGLQSPSGQCKQNEMQYGHCPAGGGRGGGGHVKTGARPRVRGCACMCVCVCEEWARAWTGMAGSAGVQGALCPWTHVCLCEDRRV